MLFKTLTIFIVLFCAIYLGIYLHNESGYIILVLRDYTIETNIWFFGGSLILIMFSIYIIGAFFNKIINIPNYLQKWVNLIKHHNSQEKTKQGLIEFNEGHWQLAKKHLIDALPNAETPLLNYLTAARAAQEMGDSTQRDNYLRQAQQSMPEAKIAVELTQAQLQIANHQWEQALATLHHLQTLSPKHPYVLKLLLKLYEEIKDWRQLINLLPIVKRYKLVSPEIFLKKQELAYFNELQNLIKQNDTKKIDDFMQHLPKELKYHPFINYEYINFLISSNHDQQAEILLRKLIQKNSESCLIYAYSKLKVEFVNLKFIESIPKAHNFSILTYCLGKIYFTKKLWGKAQTYLEESIAINPSIEAYTLLGNLFETEGKTQAALDAYKKGLTAKKLEPQIT